MDDLLQDFIGETREMLAAIAGEIVAWEADPSDRAKLDEIFRFVHTVKGSCGFLDLPRLARLSHAAEDVLGELRSGTRQPDVALVSAVLGIVDRIGELAEAIETGASLSDEDDHRLIAALTASPGEIAAETPAVAHREPGARAVSRTVRLPVELLDRMMGGVSDMVLARNELARALRETDADRAIDMAFARLSACVAEMRDAITRTRMQRIDNAFATLPRLVRDLSAELGKPMTIDIAGGDVELDREMIEMIRDPLTHIVRNAIDHGIESPEARRAAGKPIAGRLAVTARQAGNQILIEVTDDGRGIDGDKVAARAVAAGIVAADVAQRLSWAQKVELVFAPGLSTADQVTTISGRGVGMDVVRANVERIGGVVDVESRAGIGLRVSMRVPLTLTIISALTVAAGPHRFAIPRAAIDEIVRACGDHVRIDRLGGAELATVRGRRMPLVRLADLLGTGDAPAAAPILLVLRPAGGAVYALALDAVHDHEELVIKPAAPAIMAAGLYAGTTLPDDGRPMLLLDPAGIAEAAAVPLLEIAAEPAEAAEVAPTVPTLLFTDLDGRARAVRLAVVERIDEVPAEAIVHAAGRMRLVQDGRIAPLLACRDGMPAGRVTVLRLNDGATTLGYAIGGVSDIRDIPWSLAPAEQAGPIAGVMLVDGRQTEVLDPYWLFAEAARAGGPAPAATRPLAVLGDSDDPWVRDILRPLVEQAGYRVGPPSADDRADILIHAGPGAGPPAVAGGAAILRLRTHPEPDPAADSIYRYDSAGLIAALRRHAGGIGR
ncbi:chemotaxis protein CheA [Sphingomonas profundi]|uniref:chemotaxis protein CheA n=1 Tax=Alterirhizorhabdus profundi TaxID=2681549 RepID=UPI0012E8290C|nr:chemotaxis protein CheA [Sphingomonas profundi]